MLRRGAGPPPIEAASARRRAGPISCAAGKRQGSATRSCFLRRNDGRHAVAAPKWLSSHIIAFILFCSATDRRPPVPSETNSAVSSRYDAGTPSSGPSCVQRAAGRRTPPNEPEYAGCGFVRGDGLYPIQADRPDQAIVRAVNLPGQSPLAHNIPARALPREATQKPWTSAGYFKVCADASADIESWLASNAETPEGWRVPRCRSCGGDWH